jgi:hypothetical protein
MVRALLVATLLFGCAQAESSNGDVDASVSAPPDASTVWPDAQVSAADASVGMPDAAPAPADAAPPPVDAPPAGPVVVSFQNGVSPTAAYQGAADTYLSEESPTNNHGSVATVNCDGDDPFLTGRDLRGLFRFDLSTIPATATVQRVELTVHVDNHSAGQEYELYAVRRPWDEGEATWNRASSAASWGQAGAGSASDRAVEVLAVVGPDATGSYLASFTAAGVAEVQRWVGNSTLNHGFMLMDSLNSDGLDLGSSEQTVASRRPRLTVEYQP